MVPGMPGKPEEPGPNPQSCDTDCSQKSRLGSSEMSMSLSGRSGRSLSGTGGPGGSFWGVSTISVLWTFFWWNLVTASVL